MSTDTRENSPNRLRWVLYFGVLVTGLAAARAFLWACSVAGFSAGHEKNLAYALAWSLPAVIVWLIWAPLNALVRKAGWRLLKAAVGVFLLIFVVEELIDYFKS